MKISKLALAVAARRRRARNDRAVAAEAAALGPRRPARRRAQAARGAAAAAASPDRPADAARKTPRSRLCSRRCGRRTGPARRPPSRPRRRAREPLRQICGRPAAAMRSAATRRTTRCSRRRSPRCSNSGGAPPEQLRALLGNQIQFLLRANNLAAAEPALVPLPRDRPQQRGSPSSARRRPGQPQQAQPRRAADLSARSSRSAKRPGRRPEDQVYRQVYALAFEARDAARRRHCSAGLAAGLSDARELARGAGFLSRSSIRPTRRSSSTRAASCAPPGCSARRANMSPSPIR